MYCDFQDNKSWDLTACILYGTMRKASPRLEFAFSIICAWTMPTMAMRAAMVHTRDIVLDDADVVDTHQIDACVVITTVRGYRYKELWRVCCGVF